MPVTLMMIASLGVSLGARTRLATPLLGASHAAAPRASFVLASPGKLTTWPRAGLEAVVMTTSEQGDVLSGARAAAKTAAADAEAALSKTAADAEKALFKTAAGEIARKDGQNKELSARCARPARLRRRAAQPQLRRFRAVTGSAQHAGRS